MENNAYIELLNKVCQVFFVVAVFLALLDVLDDNIYERRLVAVTVGTTLTLLWKVAALWFIVLALHFKRFFLLNKWIWIRK